MWLFIVMYCSAIWCIPLTVQDSAVPSINLVFTKFVCKIKLLLTDQRCLLRLCLLFSASSGVMLICLCFLFIVVVVVLVVYVSLIWYKRMSVCYEVNVSLQQWRGHTVYWSTLTDMPLSLRDWCRREWVRPVSTAMRWERWMPQHSRLLPVSLFPWVLWRRTHMPQYVCFYMLVAFFFSVCSLLTGDEVATSRSPQLGLSFATAVFCQQGFTSGGVRKNQGSCISKVLTLVPNVTFVLLGGSQRRLCNTVILS